MSKAKKQDEGEAPKKKHAGGRPPKTTKIDLDRVKKLAATGMSDEMLAVALDIAPSTLYDYKLKWPEFSEALKSGKEDPDDRVERSLYEKAIGYSHPEEKVFCSDGMIVKETVIKHYPPDSVAAFFWLCNRRKGKWQHISRIMLSGSNGGPIEFKDMTPEEKNKRLAKVQKVIGALANDQ